MPQKKLCSKVCVTPVFVRFKNDTIHPVRIFWLDYEGNKRHYNTLNAKEFMDLNTFFTHLWIFENALTGDRYTGAGYLVYDPGLCFEALEKKTITDLFKRTCVLIRSPMVSLRTKALRAVRDNLSSPDKIQMLDVPDTVKIELTNIFRVKLCATGHSPECNCAMLTGK